MASPTCRLCVVFALCIVGISSETTPYEKLMRHASLQYSKDYQKHIHHAINQNTDPYDENSLINTFADWASILRHGSDAIREEISLYKERNGLTSGINIDGYNISTACYLDIMVVVAALPSKDQWAKRSMQFNLNISQFENVSPITKLYNHTNTCI